MDILHKGKKISVIEGSYTGYIYVDEKKYYDYRYIKAYK